MKKIILLVFSIMIISCEEKEIIKIDRENGLSAMVGTNGSWNEELLNKLGSKVKYDASATGADISKLAWRIKALEKLKAIDFKTTKDLLDTTTLKGTITSDITLDATKVYELTGKVYLESGATLKIPAGTIIFADNANDSDLDIFDSKKNKMRKIKDVDALIINKGAKILANGSVDSPIIFTRKGFQPWGGILILGNAPINVIDDVEVAHKVKLPYGGSVIKDNSGILKYVVVAYSGGQYNANERYNAFSFYGVGSGTTLENLISYKSQNDGFNWVGGTVNAKNIYSTESTNDSFYWSKGFSGTLDNIFADAPYKFCVRGANHLDISVTPSNPTVKNVTLKYRNTSAIGLIEGTYASFDNVLIEMNKGDSNLQKSIRIHGVTTVQNLLDGNIKFNRLKYEKQTQCFSGSKHSINF